MGDVFNMSPIFNIYNMANENNKRTYRRGSVEVGLDNYLSNLEGNWDSWFNDSTKDWKKLAKQHKLKEEDLRNQVREAYLNFYDATKNGQLSYLDNGRFSDSRGVLNNDNIAHRVALGYLNSVLGKQAVYSEPKVVEEPKEESKKDSEKPTEEKAEQGTKEPTAAEKLAEARKAEEDRLISNEADRLNYIRNLRAAPNTFQRWNIDSNFLDLATPSLEIPDWVKTKFKKEDGTLDDNAYQQALQELSEVRKVTSDIFAKYLPSSGITKPYIVDDAYKSLSNGPKDQLEYFFYGEPNNISLDQGFMWNLRNLYNQYSKDPNKQVKYKNNQYVIINEDPESGLLRIVDSRGDLRDVHISDIDEDQFNVIANRWAVGKFGTPIQLNKNGGVILAQNGQSLDQIKEKYKKKREEAKQTQQEQKIEQKAEETNKTPEQVEALDRKPFEGFTDVEWARISSAGLDIASMLSSFAAGPGTVVSAVTGVGSTGASAYADYMDDSMSAWDATKNLGINLGLDLWGLVPGVGASGKIAKISKNLINIVPKALGILSTLDTVQDAPEIIESFKKISDYENMTVEDWQNISRGLSLITKGTKGVQRTKKNIDESLVRKHAETGDKTIKTTDGVQRITTETADKIQSAKTTKERLEALRADKYIKELTNANNIGLTTGAKSDFKWYNPIRSIQGTPRIGTHYDFSQIKPGKYLSQKDIDAAQKHADFSGLNVTVRTPNFSQVRKWYENRLFTPSEQAPTSNKKGGVLKAQNGLDTNWIDEDMSFENYLFDKSIGGTGFLNLNSGVLSKSDSNNIYAKDFNNYTNDHFNMIKDYLNLEANNTRDWESYIRNNVSSFNSAGGNQYLRDNTLDRTKYLTSEETKKHQDDVIANYSNLNKAIQNIRGTMIDPKNPFTADRFNGDGTTKGSDNIMGIQTAHRVATISTDSSDEQFREWSNYYKDRGYKGAYNYLGWWVPTMNEGSASVKFNSNFVNNSNLRQSPILEARNKVKNNDITQEASNAEGEQIPEKTPRNYSNLLLKSMQLAPDILATGRLIGTLATNRSIYNTMRDSIRPYLKNPYNFYSPVTGAFSELQLAGAQGAQTMQMADRMATNDSDRNAAIMLEANKQRMERERQGNLTDDQKIEQRRDAALERTEKSQVSRVDTANFNREPLNRFRREQGQLESDYKLKNWNATNTYLSGLEQNMRQKAAEWRQFAQESAHAANQIAANNLSDKMRTEYQEWSKSERAAGRIPSLSNWDRYTYYQNESRNLRDKQLQEYYDLLAEINGYPKWNFGTASKPSGWTYTDYSK